MSTNVLRKTHHPLELIERLLNETSLTTKKVTHGSIIDVGGEVLDRKKEDGEEERLKALQDAVDAAEARATREMRAALRRLRKQMEDDKKSALEKQKKYYEDLSKRVADTRDRLEEERIRELRLQHEKALSDALQEQWEECERLKAIAVEKACAALRTQLRNDFVFEKEKAIADALAVAREGFRKRELEVIERTRRECEEEAAEEAARVAKKHREEINQMQHRYDILYQKFRKEQDHKERVEKDFLELQTDYQRFMDYTDGRYHSDYMMMLRKHGLTLAKKKISVVTHEEVRKLQL